MCDKFVREMTKKTTKQKRENQRCVSVPMLDTVWSINWSKLVVGANRKFQKQTIEIRPGEFPWREVTGDCVIGR